MGVVAGEEGVVRNEGRARAARDHRVGRTQHLLNHGMTSLDDLEHIAVIEGRAGVVPFAAEQRPAGEDVDFGERVGGLREGD